MYTFTMKYDMFYSVSSGKKFEHLEEKMPLCHRYRRTLNVNCP